MTVPSSFPGLTPYIYPCYVSTMKYRYLLVVALVLAACSDSTAPEAKAPKCLHPIVPLCVIEAKR